MATTYAARCKIIGHPGRVEVLRGIEAASAREAEREVHRLLAERGLHCANPFVAAETPELVSYLDKKST